MEELNKIYQTSLDNIKSTIQSSDILAKYLDEEEDDIYQEMREQFEPQIEELHNKVAAENPLQLVKFEEYIFDDEFEGLYLPRILGYSVLRGEINSRIKFIRPQDHFKDVLVTICNSNNFEILKQRIGQAIQVGFALSSDIWITNIINSIANKKVKSFLAAQKLDKYRDQQIRLSGLVKYRKQFESLNYQTAEFPQDHTSLVHLSPSLKSFIKYRANNSFDNSSLMPSIDAFINNKNIVGSQEYCELLILISKAIDLDATTKKSMVAALESIRENDSEFGDDFFSIINHYFESGYTFSIEDSQRLSSVVTRNIKDELSVFFNLLDIVLSKGYIHEESIDAVRVFYDAHEGLSVQNESLRYFLKGYFKSFMKNLSVESYQDYFEMNKTFVAYISIFSNQEFNQSIKEMSLAYVKKLKKRYTDKRGKDYQDIKKFVKSTFLDLGFMKEKGLVEFFKTKRKKS